MLYIFELGREKELAKEEIMSALQSLNITHTKIIQSGSFFYIEADSLDPAQLMKILGSTISIGVQMDKKTDADTMADIIDSAQSAGKIQFSLRGTKNSQKSALEIKKVLKSRGRSVRYIAANNAATIIHNHLIKKSGDYIVTEQGVFMTRAIQDIEDFTKRDYDRPGTDSKSGMLPPKLARTMINLSMVSSDKKIYDPFCGSGTVLTEAALMGFTELFGSDISEQALRDTRRNLTWVKEEYDKSFEETIFEANATNIEQTLPQIDLIVTEPYLGKPLQGDETEHFLRKQAGELRALYSASLREFHRVLGVGGTVVIAVPHFRTGDRWVESIDGSEIEGCGFVVIPFGDTPFIRYHRPDQHLGRAVYRLKKK
jgi:tRNA G10  N-methylase Trm11